MHTWYRPAQGTHRKTGKRCENQVDPHETCMPRTPCIPPHTISRNTLRRSRPSHTAITFPDHGMNIDFPVPSPSLRLENASNLPNAAEVNWEIITHSTKVQIIPHMLLIFSSMHVRRHVIRQDQRVIKSWLESTLREYRGWTRGTIKQMLLIATDV